MTRAVQYAREDGCPGLVLTVDIDNRRALRYYSKLGFDIARHRMCTSIDNLHLE
jgi:ribosomal protein S18 acetylase RimI-like enzyme